MACSLLCLGCSFSSNILVLVVDGWKLLNLAPLSRDKEGEVPLRITTTTTILTCPTKQKMCLAVVVMVVD